MHVASHGSRDDTVVGLESFAWPEASKMKDSDHEVQAALSWQGGTSQTCASALHWSQLSPNQLAEYWPVLAQWYRSCWFLLSSPSSLYISILLKIYGISTWECFGPLQKFIGNFWYQHRVFFDLHLRKLVSSLKDPRKTRILLQVSFYTRLRYLGWQSEFANWSCDKGRRF